jgi:hypothetical protein
VSALLSPAHPDANIAAAIAAARNPARINIKLFAIRIGYALERKVYPSREEREKRMERKKMTPEELESRLGSTDGWKVDGETLCKRFEFANFAESLDFVNKVGP